MREGILDLNCPMTYFSRTKSAAKWAGWNRFAKDRQYGHQCALGVGLYQNLVPDSLAMIRETRLPTAQGSRAAGAVLYCYDTPKGVNGQEVEGDTELFAALPNVWKHDAPPPAMPWKTQPTTGAVMGTLLGGDSLTPADGAKLILEDQARHVRRTALADGNGRFAFLRLPPGPYQVTAAWPGSRYTLYARVRPGHVARLTVAETGGAISLLRVTGISAQPEGARVVLGQVLVASGSDKLGDHFFVADGFGQAPIRVDAPGLVPPTIMGDQVVVAGTLHHTPGGVVLTASAVRLVGMQLVTALAPGRPQDGFGVFPGARRSRRRKPSQVPPTQTAIQPRPQRVWRRTYSSGAERTATWPPSCWARVWVL